MSTTQLVLFLAAAALVLAAIWVRWKQAALVRPGWTPWLLGVIGVGCLGIGLVLGDLFPKDHHKPVNVSNINVLEDPSNAAFVPGASLTYFSAKAFPAEPPPYQVFKYGPSPTFVEPIPGGFPMPPQSIAVLPIDGTKPETLLVAAGSEVYYWKSDYEKCTPATDTKPVVSVHALRADKVGSLMLAQYSASEIAIYTFTIPSEPITAPPTYSLVAGSAKTAKADHPVRALELSPAGFRRAAFILLNGTKRQFYTWAGNGPPVVVPNLKPLMMNAGLKLLVARDVSPYIVEVVQPGAFKQLPHDGNKELDDVYGITTWKGQDWVLAKSNDKTTLWKVANGKLKWVEEFADLVSDGHKPRGFVPLGGSLGLITGKQTFWNIVPEGDHESSNSGLMKHDYVVKTMWPCNNEALFAAVDEGGDVEPWRWWTDLED